MIKLASLYIAVALLTMGSPSMAADAVYTWTDQDGTRHFSSERPPDNIRSHRLEEDPLKDNKKAQIENRRASYDQMVRRAKTQSLRFERKRKQEADARAQEQRRQEIARHKNQLKAQREALEKKIAAIKGRGLSPTYTRGMQEAQIKEIEKRIEQLTNSENTSNPAKK